jgi:VWFA-related protein
MCGHPDLQAIDGARPFRATPGKRENSMIRTIAIFGLAALLGFFAPARAQQPAPESQAPAAQPGRQQLPPRIIVHAYTVIVPVTVKDSRGQLVAGLQKSDFQILADNVQQQIENFSADPMPLSAVVLIDNDLPNRSATQVQNSLVAVSAGFGHNDEVALVTYDKFPTTVSNFTFSNDKLFTELQRLDLGSHTNMVIADPTTAGPMANGKPLPTGTGVPMHGSGRYVEHDALNDAIYASAEMLKPRGRDRRKIIFLISDGANSSNNAHTFDETLHYLLSNDISVYSISVTHSVPFGRKLVQRGLAEIDKYALDTGGDTYFAGKQRDLERMYTQVTEQARNQYTLTFSPHSVSVAKDYHSIEVRVDRPDLTIETRQGYYDSSLIPAQ